MFRKRLQLIWSNHVKTIYGREINGLASKVMLMSSNGELGHYNKKFQNSIERFHHKICH